MLNVFLQRVPINECIETFKSLAQTLFSRSHSKGNIFRFLRRLLKCWYFDGYYDSTILEEALRANLGFQSRMFEHRTHPSSIKVGVTAATIGNSSPVVFTNYNGVGTRKEDCGIGTTNFVHYFGAD